jgi:anti-sigma factor RsiW
LKHLSGSDIQDYLDGAGGNRRAIEEHLAGCEECLVRLAEYRVLYTRLADASCLPEAPGREDAVMARIKERERGKPALWVPDLILAAAGALLAVLAVLLFLDLSALAAGLKLICPRPQPLSS